LHKEVESMRKVFRAAFAASFFLAIGSAAGSIWDMFF